MSLMEGPMKLASFSKKAFISSSVSARMFDTEKLSLPCRSNHLAL